MMPLWLQVVIAFFGTVVFGIVSFFTLKAQWKRDEVTKEAGLVTAAGDSISSAIEGLNALNEALQRNNLNVREERDLLREAAARCKQSLERANRLLVQSKKKEAP